MIELKEVREYLKSSGLADNFYIGHLDDKKDKSIGVYQLNRSNEFFRAIGEPRNDTTKMKSVSVLVHWNKNAAETETAAKKVYNYIRDTAPRTLIGNNVVNFMAMLYNEPIDVGTDDQKVYERVIDFIIYYNEK